MIRRTGVTLILLLAISPRPLDAQSPGTAWVITNATLIDGTGALPIPAAHIVGRGDRITCAGRRADCPTPDGAVVLDAAGKWAVPGLIDTHVHLRWNSEEEASRRQLIRFALGITTTRDAGTPGQLAGTLAARLRSNDSETPEPRLVVSGLVIPKGDVDGNQAAALARQLAGLGVDAIKIKAELSAAALVAIGREAHAFGLPFWGHTWSPHASVLAAALDARIDGVTHMFTFSEYGVRKDPARPAAPEGLEYWVWAKEAWNYQDETRLGEAIDRLLAQQVWLEPLLVTERYFTLPHPVPAEFDYLDTVLSLEQILRRSLPVGDTGWRRRRERRERLDVVYGHMCDVVERFHRRGGIIVTGSDESRPGLALLEEIVLLSGCGFTPAAAIEAATRHAAAVLRRRDIGTIETGKLADIVLLDGNPLEDLAHLRRTWRVMKGGRIHDPAVLLRPFAVQHTWTAWTTWTIRIALLGALIAPAGIVFSYWKRRKPWG